MSFGRIHIILLFVVYVACQKPLPRLEGVDKAAWKRDKNACIGLRSSMEDAINHQKNKLRALSETQIMSLLGRPDKSELHKRNKKLYVYYLAPSKLCKAYKGRCRVLVVRFNAVGMAQEVFIREEII